MKKIYSILLSVLTAAILFTACNPKDFGDINKDPNNPSTAFTNYLFTNACTYVPYFVLGSATNGYDPWQQEWTGYISESKNNQYGPLGTTAQYSTVGTIYLYALRNLDQIITMNMDEDQKSLSNVGILGSNNNQIAVAKTLSAFYYMSLTDIVGPIVLSEAFKGKTEEIWKPKYDTQESVYKQLDEMLNEAYGLFDNGAFDGAADVLYKGDISKWKKFNASLRMLLAIKMCDVDPANGKARFAKAYNDGGMTGNDDSFMYTYDDLTWNRLYYWVSPDYSGAGFNAVPNKFIVDQMKEFKDDRMWAYFDIEGYRGSRDPEIFPRDSHESFYGVPFGLESNDAVNAWTDCCASINSKLLGMTATVPVIPAARVLLTEAEAAYRGWISADAKALYEAGIAASFEQWGVAGADKYIASPAIAYQGADKGLEQIALQRWIASYMSDGVEAWSDWRRLDIPKMPVGPGAAALGNNHYPYRLQFYADTDVAYNEENYLEAVKDLRGAKDDVTSRLWWDVNPNEEGVLSDDECTPSVQIPAKWEEKMSGTYYFFGSIEGMYANESPLGSDLFGNLTMETKLYNDLNHPTEWKISPFGDGTAELFLTWDDASETFFIPNQIVGMYNGHPINAADRDTDQGTDNKYRGEWDSDDGCLYLYIMYRQDGPRNGVNPLLQYGYEVFEPAGE